MSSFKSPNLPALYVANQYESDWRKFARDLLTTLGEAFKNLTDILNRGISISDNLDCRLVTVTTDLTPGTEFSVAHTLGKVPTGYIVYGQNAAGSVYDGTTANTKTALYLKSDVSSKTFKVIVF